MTFNTNTPELDLKMPELILQAVVGQIGDGPVVQSNAMQGERFY